MTKAFNKTKNILGGMDPQHFLSEYWHKKPLLIRQAVPGFSGLISPHDLFKLASRDEVESRLIEQKNEHAWDLAHGPFTTKELKRRQTQSAWTILVQGLNLYLPEAEALMHQFSFIPYARLDDVMMSYAQTHGGVGPHFDSYDVFLLQGNGRKRWSIAETQDLTLVEDLPVRILKHFEAEQSWELEPGDMLYLPPRYAHDGVALSDDCTTYSIGFRAPSARELTAQYLLWLSERISDDDSIVIDERYQDPLLHITQHPAKIPTALIDFAHRCIANMTFDTQNTTQFLGTYLSEPKTNVFFDPPNKPLSFTRFSQQLQQWGLKQSPGGQILFSEHDLFINGEIYALTPEHDHACLLSLANNRYLNAPIVTQSTATLELLHEAYCAGYLLWQKNKQED